MTLTELLRRYVDDPTEANWQKYVQLLGYEPPEKIWGHDKLQRREAAKRLVEWIDGGSAPPHCL